MKLALRPFTSKDFEGDAVIDLMSRLVKIPTIPGRENGVELEKLKSLTPEEIKVEFAQRLNDGRLTFSTYTHRHLDKRRNINNAQI